MERDRPTRVIANCDEVHDISWIVTVPWPPDPGVPVAVEGFLNDDFSLVNNLFYGQAGIVVVLPLDLDKLPVLACTSPSWHVPLHVIHGRAIVIEGDTEERPFPLGAYKLKETSIADISWVAAQGAPHFKGLPLHPAWQDEYQHQKDQDRKITFEIIHCFPLSFFNNPFVFRRYPILYA